MSKMIFVNLPVTDLAKSMAFYEALGFTNNPQFTDENAACMVWSEAIFVMLLSHGHWRKFTQRPFPAEGTSEVMLAVNLDSTDEVNRLVDLSGAQGGTADVNPKQDHGFMVSRSFADPDGHVWEAFWMDPAAMGGGES